MAIDLLRQGSQWLEQKRAAYCASPIEYRRPPESTVVSATYGKTDVELADESGLTIRSYVWDFLVLASDLQPRGWVPEPGDIIAADGQLFEVMNLAGEGCWRWSDPYRMTYRIHTREIGQDEQAEP